MYHETYNILQVKKPLLNSVYYIKQHTIYNLVKLTEIIYDDNEMKLGEYYAECCYNSTQSKPGQNAGLRHWSGGKPFLLLGHYLLHRKVFI